MTRDFEPLRAFIDRVLRLKEEQDALGKDIKEVYAEAKSTGYDKTVMGQVVAYLRKREKDATKLEESEAIFDVYLHAYNRGTSLATHARENGIADPPHDEDGVLIEEPASAPSDAEAGQEGGLSLSVAPPSVAVILPDLATVAPDPSPEVRSGAPISDITAEAVADLQAKADVILNQTDDWADLEIPKQFRREKAA